jgi:hypothetical protein
LPDPADDIFLVGYDLIAVKLQAVAGQTADFQLVPLTVKIAKILQGLENLAACLVQLQQAFVDDAC